MKLNELVAEMLLSDVPVSRVLSRGLALAYSPEMSIGSSTGSRFVWSRYDGDPSDVEDKILKKAIERGMRKNTSMIVVGGPTFRTALRLKTGTRWGSSMLYWEWVGSSQLMLLQGNKRLRAMEWLGR